MTANESYKSLTTLHLALLAGVSIVAVLIYFTGSNWTLNYLDTENIFFFIVPLISTSGIAIGHQLFHSRVDELSERDSLDWKLEGFREASILKYVMIEGPALIGVIAAMDSENLLYLIIAAGMIAYLYSQRPTREKTEAYLNLDSEMAQQFRRSQ